MRPAGHERGGIGAMRAWAAAAGRGLASADDRAAIRAEKERTTENAERKP